MQNDRKALNTYLAVVMTVSFAIEAVWIYFGEAATQAGISTLLMMVPWVVAAIVGRVFYKKQGALGFRRCKAIFCLLPVLIPLVYLGLSYGLYWILAKGSFTGSLSVLADYASVFSGRALPEHTAVVIALIVMLPITMVTALGEEAGWRGFMYPVMQRVWGYKKACLASSIVWALWHLPIVLAGLYYPPSTNLFYLVPAFCVEILALSMILTCIRTASNSVWPAVLLHALHNYFDQIVFQSLTRADGSIYFVGEIGIITLAFTVFLAALIFVRSRKSVFENGQTGQA